MKKNEKDKEKPTNIMWTTTQERTVRGKVVDSMLMAR